MVRFTFAALVAALTASACDRAPSETDANGVASGIAANGAAEAAPVVPASSEVNDAVPLPAFAEGTPYPQVRQRLQQTGWSPFTPPGDMRVPSGIRPRGCAPGDDACNGFTETIFCIGANSHSCWHAWRRGKEYLLIEAVGEMEGQLFGELRQCSAIEVSNSDPWQWCTPPGPAGSANAAPLPAERPSDLGELLKLFPSALPAWQRVVRPARGTDWIYQLAANSSEVRYLRLQNVEYAHGGFCKPHDCFDNNGSYLIALDGSRAVGATMSSHSTWTGVGWVRESTRVSFFGDSSPQERDLLRTELHRTAF